ncbi:lipocalin family protein [Roseobacter sp. HKCCA0434]|uniref:lipocalin family protein n=1 Tax=Roseobacter sp. HKCCA0434 TaxID=3079297 RepID=UPI002905CF77|nr:lipocalin family protein [Roseobacter sp. HKCCA0434]
MTRLALLLVLALSACGTPAWRDAAIPVRPAMGFELDRYLGEWYEIARFPNRFEEGCTDVTAAYDLNEDGTVAVTNSCPNRDEMAEGTAETTDDPAVLRVSFAPGWVPFATADYIVIWVDQGYQTAVVASPEAGLGWILARDRQPDAARLEEARDVLRANGYDPSALIEPVQVTGL